MAFNAPGLATPAKWTAFSKASPALKTPPPVVIIRQNTDTCTCKQVYYEYTEKYSTVTA